MLIEEALEVVNDWTAEELRTLDHNELMFIIDGICK
jgi:hypothetical protein